MTLKKVLLVLVGGPAFLFVVALAIVVLSPETAARLHEQAESVRAADSVNNDANTAAVAVEKPAAPEKSCQVVTNFEPLREGGQNLCKSGLYSTVEINLEDGELVVFGFFHPTGERRFRAGKAGHFAATRQYVDGLHNSSSFRRSRYISFQMFVSPKTHAVDGEPTITGDLVGLCTYQFGETRCKDYTGPKPTWVQ